MKFSPNGKLLAFTSISEVRCEPSATACATWELWTVRADGSGVHEVTADGKYPRFSPDGRYLAFLGGYSAYDQSGTVVAQSLVTGKRTWFSLGVDAAPAWSARGDKLTYSSGKVHVATVAPRHVSTLSEGFSPVFSPDGRKVAYVNGRGLFVGKKLLAPDAQAGVAWTRNWLVYVALTSEYPLNYELFRVRPDGTHRGLIRAYGPTTYMEIVQGDAASVLFLETRSRYTIETIDAVDVATGRERVVRADSVADLGSTVSAAGVLSFSRGSARQYGWFCLYANGRCLVPAETLDGVRDPVWSSDGRQLAAIDFKPHAKRDLIVVDAATAATRVLATFSAYVGSPSWSPDGSTIVVASTQSGPVNDGHSHLWLVDTTTGFMRQVAPTDDELAPSWSPDGSAIAFVGGPFGGPFSVSLYDVASGAVHPLDLPAAAVRSAWSPDGTQIAWEAPDFSVHVARRDGSGDRLLVHNAAGTALAWGP